MAEARQWEARPLYWVGMAKLERSKARCLIWIVAVLATVCARGHVAPRGDVYPIVIAQQGVFHVCSFLNSGADDREIVFRSIHKPDGVLMVPRHRVMDEALLKRLKTARLRPGWGPVNHDPCIVRLTPRHPTDGVETKEQQLVLRTWNGGAASDEPLLFDVAESADLTSQFIAKEWGALLWSKTDYEAKGTTLHLTWFQRSSTATPITRELGICGTIYDFPSASDLVWAGGRLWVAWIREESDQKHPPSRHWRTMLTSFDPVTGKTASKELPGISHWNSSLSIAETKGWLCIAWHCSKDMDYPGEAVIVTAFEKIPPPP